MKRRTTEFEQKLIDNGWKLIYKTYRGKKSQFVWTYVYSKFHNGYLFKLAIDQKRIKTLNIYIENATHEYLDLAQLQNMVERYNEILEEIHLLEFGKPFEESWNKQ